MDRPTVHPEGNVSEPPAAKQGSLHLINTSLSSNGKYIHIHFVGDPNQVVTLQLEIPIATKFYESLGALLNPVKGKEAPRELWH